MCFQEGREGKGPPPISSTGYLGELCSVPTILGSIGLEVLISKGDRAVLRGLARIY